MAEEPGHEHHEEHCCDDDHCVLCEQEFGKPDEDRMQIRFVIGSSMVGFYFLLFHPYWILSFFMRF